MKRTVRIKLDFDTRQRRRKEWRNRLWLLAQLFPGYRFKRERWTTSKHGWHCEIPVTGKKRALSPVAVVAMQLILGSDVKREAYNLARAMRSGVSPFWRERGNVLYLRKLK